VENPNNPISAVGLDVFWSAIPTCCSTVLALALRDACVLI